MSEPRSDHGPPLREDFLNGATYDDVLIRAAEALFDAELGPYAESIGESWQTQKQEMWKATADTMLRRIGVTCLFCPAWDGSFNCGFPECAGCHPEEVHHG